MSSKYKLLPSHPTREVKVLQDFSEGRSSQGVWKMKSMAFLGRWFLEKNVRLAHREDTIGNAKSLSKLVKVEKGEV